jgi:hypothetical protein
MIVSKKIKILIAVKLTKKVIKNKTYLELIYP